MGGGYDVSFLASEWVTDPYYNNIVLIFNFCRSIWRVMPRGKNFVQTDIWSSLLNFNSYSCWLSTRWSCKLGTILILHAFRHLSFCFLKIDSSHGVCIKTAYLTHMISIVSTPVINVICWLSPLIFSSISLINIWQIHL